MEQKDKREKQEKKGYDSKEAESRIQKFWEKERIYKFEKKSKKKIFSIDTPPPTVSGKMHLGHAFSYNHLDIITRFKRMSGYNIFFPFGTDDNGLATEMMIESMLGKSAEQFKREEFIKIVLEKLRQIRKQYVADWKRIGMSCDWSIFYTTIDKHCRRISQKSFLDIYSKGRAYQREAPTIFCTRCKTAIAQAEQEDIEKETIFSHVVFLIDGKEVQIATTRPELLSSCVAVFYNPSDKRYKKYKGKKAKIPLFNFFVPVLEDKNVDMSKGTGIVMCCTFGDAADVEWFYSHNLPLRISITKEGRMNENAKGYEGMSIEEARAKIIEDLEKQGLIKRKERIMHSVPVHERCKNETEFLVTKQWFVNYMDMKKIFLEAGNKLRWHPQHMKNRYDNWIRGLKWDWCISRQRYYGVPFPVWYCKKCNAVILASEENLPVDPLSEKPKKKCKCSSSEFEPEKDVLDTWFTSSLTPEIAASLFPKLFRKLFPMSLRSQAHDIITFWLFNTVVKSMMHYKKNPWDDVMISGYALDPKGEKMSKSKGNIIEPQAMIKKYCADALRFWAASSKLGEDLPFQEKEFVAGMRTITKIFNASRFVFLHAKKKQKKAMLCAFDSWLLSKLNNLIEDVTSSLQEYEYSRLKAETENFFWHVFCDNYLEIVKDRLYNKERSKEDREAACYTLYNSMLIIIKLFAPIMPHITEYIYQKYFRKNEKIKSIHVSEWPKAKKEFMNKKIEEKGDFAISMIEKIRQFKSRNQKSLKIPIALTIEKKVLQKLKPFLQDLKAVTCAKEIREGKFNIRFC